MKTIIHSVFFLFIIVAFSNQTFANEIESVDNVKIKLNLDHHVQGVSNSNENLSTSDNESDFMAMRIRFQAEAEVTEALTFNFGADALDRVWGTDHLSTSPDDENIEFKYGYFSYTTPIGVFNVGRILNDYRRRTFLHERSYDDSISWFGMIETDFATIYPILEYIKSDELDRGTALSDRDNDQYNLFFVVNVTEKNYVTFGVANYRYNTFASPDQPVAGNTLALAAGEATGVAPGMSTAQAVATAVKYGADALDPTTYAPALSAFGKGKATGYTIEAMVNKWNITASGRFSYFVGEYEPVVAVEQDFVGIGSNAQLNYDTEMFGLEAGYARVSGDANYDDNEMNSLGFVLSNANFQKAFILNGGLSELHGVGHGMQNSFAGGLGNLNAGPLNANVANIDGFEMLYIGAYVNLPYDITVGGLIAMSEADDTPAGVSNDHGTEYDLTLSWQINKNLKFDAVAAYLDAGDYWKERGGISDFEDSIASFSSKVTLTF